MRTLDPANMAQRFVRAFHAALAQGRVDRGPALAMLRAYRARSRAAGADCRFGVAELMAAALGLTDADLEGPAGAGEGEDGPPPLPAGGGVDPGSAATLLAVVLAGSGAWRLASDPGLLPDSAWVYMSVPTASTPVLLSRATPPLMDAASLLRLMETRRALAPLLLAGCVLGRWSGYRAVQTTDAELTLLLISYHDAQDRGSRRLGRLVRAGARFLLHGEPTALHALY